MLSEERHRRIVAEVRRHGSASVTALSTALDVSEATIRRDLDLLADAGRVRRVRGGACDLSDRERPEPDARPFEDVAAAASDSKAAIARRAASLVQDGEVIALDIGTTVAAMCPELKDRSLTVVTSSLAVINALAEAPGIDLVVLGGMLRPTYRSMVGSLTESALRQLRVDRAFLGAAGIRADGTVIDSTPSEVPVKRGLLDIATAAYLLADHDKLPGTGFLEVARLSAFDGLVTDRPLGDGALDLPEDEMTEVLLP